MSALKLHTLKQKLWAIVAASFVARVIVFFAIEDTTTSIAPDEGTYAFLVKWISESKPASEFPDFGEHLYLSARSIVIPASIFSRLGISELSALRITASVYGFLSLCVFAYLCSKLLSINSFGVMKKRRLERLVVALFMVYAFLPSHFLWSNLGLRESPNEFWLILTFTGVFLLYREGQSLKPLLVVLITISIICTFSSRPQVGWVLVLTLLIYSIFKMKNHLTYLLIVSVLTSVFVGYLATTSYEFFKTDVYLAKAGSTISINASKLCDGTERKVEHEGEVYDCIYSGSVTKSKLSSSLSETAIGYVAGISEKQSVNQAGAASIIQRFPCPWEASSEIGKYGCLAVRAPYMALTFLFRPLPFIDTTSLSSTFAAAENAIWIFMFALIFYKASKVKRIPFLSELAPAYIFFLLYVVGAGSYEGNMGTAFRHKSLILWVPLLLLFALFWYRDSQSRETNGNNSQEGAV